MCTYPQVFSWLNETDTTHIPPSLRVLLGLMTATHNELELDDLISQVLRESRTSGQPLQHAEVLLACAEHKYRRMNYPDGIRLLDTAFELYFTEKDYHRIMVTRWLQGLTHQKMGEERVAFDRWFEGSQIAEKFIDRYQRLDLPVVVQWVEDKLGSIQVEMAYLMDEIYTWLNFFEPESYELSIKALLNSTLERIDEQRFESARKNILELNRLSHQTADHQEAGLIQFECGRLCYILKDFPTSIKYFEQAATLFSPFEHHYGVTRWAIGLLQWKEKSSHSQAIHSCQMSIDVLSHLALDADHKNHQKRRLWYEKKKKVLERALENKILKNP